MIDGGQELNSTHRNGCGKRRRLMGASDRTLLRSTARQNVHVAATETEKCKFPLKRKQRRMKNKSEEIV